MDPETLHGVMAPYYDVMRTAVERHGGRVEKFIGDAVVGVFGAVTLTEDDALRAVRAADDMRTSLVELNVALRSEYAVELQARIGVSTGELVVQDSVVVLGDVGNTAARLQQAAAAGDLLVAEATFRLVCDAVSAERLELKLKGKPGTSVAHRILEVRRGASGLSRKLDAVIVGRQSELVFLAETFAHVCDTPASHLVTVSGDAGIGKSRLVLHHLDDVRRRATVVSGRCLSYGEGITLRPIVEVLRGLVGQDLARGLREVLGSGTDAIRASAHILAATGIADAELSGLETWWAVRTVLSAALRGSPIVVVIEDIQWAEPALLDLIEYLVERLKDAPILFVCVARPELLERRPDWGAGPSRTMLHLPPLSDDHAARLVDQLGVGGLDEALKRRIIAVAHGNPLFLEQMAALPTDARGAFSERATPPLISALLTARLDRLSPDERRVLGGAAVEGEVFHRSSVAALAEVQDPDALDALLDRLGDLELIHPAVSEFVGEAAFRFRHGLMRDAAYAAVSKRLRSTLHQRHADWLAESAADRASEFDEILGYHLERAFRLLEDLGPVSPDQTAIAQSGSARLAAAGQRAFARGDMHAATNLLRRSTNLLDADDPRRLQWMCDLEYAAFFTEANWAATESRLADVIARANRLGLEAVRWRAVAQRGRAILFIHPDHDTDALLREAGEATDALEQLGDEIGLARAWGLVSHLRLIRGDVALAAEASANAASHSIAAGSRQEELTEYVEHAWIVAHSPYSVEQDLDRCARLVACSSDTHRAKQMMLLAHAYLEALVGRPHIARQCLARFYSATLDLGWKYHSFNLAAFRGHVERLAGNSTDAETAFLDAGRIVSDYGNRLTAATMTAQAARSAYEGKHYDRAHELLAKANDLDGERDIGLHGLLLAEDGDWAGADDATRDAVQRSHETDCLEVRGEALLDRSRVLELQGNRPESCVLAHQARQRFEMRQSPVLVRRAREVIDRVNQTIAYRIRVGYCVSPSLSLSVSVRSRCRERSGA